MKVPETKSSSSNSGRSRNSKNLRRSSSSRSQGSRSGGRRRYDDNKIRRGTGRGEVPEPTIETVGGSRIVARKLY